MGSDRDSRVERLEFERDIYQRASNIAMQALNLISVYHTAHGNPESFLAMNGHSQHTLNMMREGSESHWEYLRKLDYEVADISLRNAEEVLMKLKEKPDG